MEKSQKKQTNIYSITTYVLLAIIIIIGAIYLFNIHSEKKLEQGIITGQQNALAFVINDVAKNGYTTITGDRFNMTLVPAQSIQVAQEEVIKYILNSIRTQGYISLYDNESEVILVPYVPQEQAQIEQ